MAIPASSPQPSKIRLGGPPSRPRACPERSRRGGRRPGAGAPRGNLNALKHVLSGAEGTGRYSRRLAALTAALDAMPKTAGVLVKMTARDRTSMEMLAYGLQSGACPRAKRRAEMLLLIARGGSISDLDEPQLRRRALYAIPIKQSAIALAPPDGEDSH